MDKIDVLKFISENPVFYLATSDKNIPYVRIMTVCKADENGIIFNTKKYKRSFEELSKNPNIEMCFYNKEDDIQIRVFGKVEKNEDLYLKKCIVNDFPRLKNIIKEHGYSAIIPFCLKKWGFKICDRH